MPEPMTEVLRSILRDSLVNYRDKDLSTLSNENIATYTDAWVEELVYEVQTLTLKQRRDGVTFVCGGTPTPEGQRELDDFATYLRVKGRIEKQNQTQRREGVSAAMVPLARLGAWALQHIRGVCAGDIDAFDLQDQAVRLGVIAGVKAPRPCGECCVCEEMEADVCYRDTDATKAARAALAASGEGA